MAKQKYEYTTLLGKHSVGSPRSIMTSGMTLSFNYPVRNNQHPSGQPPQNWMIFTSGWFHVKSAAPRSALTQDFYETWYKYLYALETIIPNFSDLSQPWWSIYVQLHFWNFSIFKEFFFFWLALFKKNIWKIMGNCSEMLTANASIFM